MDYTSLIKEVNIPELVKALRHCSGTPYARCSNCPMHDKGVADYATPCGILSDAAAEIESLLSFAHYVADKVTMSDEDWEDYHEAFAEVACRKLVKLGVISIEDNKYVYRRDEPPQEAQNGSSR